MSLLEGAKLFDNEPFEQALGNIKKQQVQQLRHPTIHTQARDWNLTLSLVPMLGGERETRSRESLFFRVRFGGALRLCTLLLTRFQLSNTGEWSFVEAVAFLELALTCATDLGSVSIHTYTATSGVRYKPAWKFLARHAGMGTTSCEFELDGILAGALKLR